MFLSFGTKTPIKGTQWTKSWQDKGNKFCYKSIFSLSLLRGTLIFRFFFIRTGGTPRTPLQSDPRAISTYFNCNTVGVGQTYQRQLPTRWFIRLGFLTVCMDKCNILKQTVCLHRAYCWFPNDAILPAQEGGAVGPLSSESFLTLVLSAFLWLFLGYTK